MTTSLSPCMICNESILEGQQTELLTKRGGDGGEQTAVHKICWDAVMVIDNYMNNPTFQTLIANHSLNN